MFGYELVKKDEAPKRGNLKMECCIWTLAAFSIVVILLVSYDFVALRWLDPTSAKNECFARFSYTHLGTLISFIAAVFAFLAIVVTAKVNETMNLHSFNLRYGDDKMLAAVRTIGDVERRWEDLRKAGVSPSALPFDIPPDVDNRTDTHNKKGHIVIKNYSTFVTATERFKPWTEEEDKARRLVKNYFSSALELYRCGGISKKTLRVVCDTDAVTLLFNVIEPMEYITNEKYKSDVFHDLMNVLRDVYARKLRESAAHKKTSHFKARPSPSAAKKRPSKRPAKARKTRTKAKKSTP